MALTGYEDDTDYTSSDDGAAEAEVPEEVGSAEENEAELHGLTESNLEEHNKNTGEEIQECNNRHETGTEVPSEVGAGLLFGLSGLFLGGPILGVLTGVGAALVATNNNGPVGEAARASGDFAVTTGSKVGEAAKEANEKHHILDKIRNAFYAGWNKVRQFDEEHHATERIKETMSDVTQKTVEFEKRHHVVEHVLEGIQNGVNFLLEKLRDGTSGERSADTPGEGEKNTSAS